MNMFSWGVLELIQGRFLVEKGFIWPLEPLFRP